MPHGVCLDCAQLQLDLFVFIKCSNGEHCREPKTCFGGQKTTIKKQSLPVSLDYWFIMMFTIILTLCDREYDWRIFQLAVVNSKLL